MMKKLAIIVGHNASSQGAVRPDTRESEYVYNGKLADYMEKIGHEYEMEVKTFRRRTGGGYSREIARCYAEVDQWGANASIELHFNAAGDPSASGTETLSSGSAKSVILAQEVQMELVEALGLNDRGVKIRNSRTKGRGYLSLVSGQAPAIIAEPFFATSERGRTSSDELFERERIAEAILEGAATALSKI
jgi:N-acetylmuramoyl-L-alanine amidase